MSEDSNCRRRVRPLYAWEAAEARQVFGDSLRYDRVRIHECATWTDAIDRLGRRLKRMPPPGLEQHNSVTLGYHCYFPVSLPDRLVPPGHPLDFCMPWLIHELTHAWQYQHVGWIYLARALAAQFRYGTAAYDFGGEANLVKCRQNHWTITKFNPEQQGDIARYYYYGLRSTNAIDEPNKQNELSAYQPYICDIQETATLARAG
jgi:hypothetical protein